MPSTISRNGPPILKTQDSYEQKRNEVRQSPSHFVEIDLLCDGKSIYTRKLIPKCDYYVHVSRKGERPKGIVWPIQLPQRLPPIDIPLLPEDADVKLDLQAVLDTAYDRAGYDLVVNYQSEPVPPLSKERAGWSHGLLQVKGLL